MGETPEISKGSYKRILGVLFHLTKLANEGVSVAELLQAVATQAAPLLGADSCAVMLLDEPRRELLCKAAFGLTGAEEDRLSFRMGEGIAGWVALHGQPVRLSQDAASDPRFKAVEGQVLQIAALLCVPLRTSDGVIGTLTVTSARAGAFTAEHEELLAYLAGAIVKDLENARLYRLSITDPLTKAYNRQYLFQRLPSEIERCRRYGEPFSVLLFDVDHFKAVNDQHGHEAGDLLLKELAFLAQGTVREVDGLVRYGGEEFLLLLPKTDQPGALEVAERLRSEVEAARFPFGDKELRVTVSVGVASFGKDAESDVQLIRKADERLMRAKSEGRNRICASP